MKKIVAKPTRIDKITKAENILDLIFTNNPANLKEYLMINLGTGSDHLLIKSEVTIHEKMKDLL